MSTAIVADPRDAAAPAVVGDVACVQLTLVNAYLVGPRGAADRQWVLVDAGMSMSAPRIIAAAADRFGPTSRPAAIVLTHGHFDHVGSVRALAEKWDAPVFAHPLELPYLNGDSDYPPPDPTVGGGLMAYMSPLFSRKGIDLGERLYVLPTDGSVPGMPGWRWIHTPGHAPGHVSLFRDADRTLIAGDAFVTQKQESALAVMTRAQRVHGPPAYFTIDWGAAERSVRELARLRPEVAATGHGIPMAGGELRRQLDDLAAHFRERAVPADGRYVRRPAVTDERGVRFIPLPVSDQRGAWIAAGLVLGVAAWALWPRGR
ncbi:MAG TPA: MBL fold metallo-hydrolase [Gemmataceae bacterium]|nr:MBL fold metallo-hydrolase [Gemmataceae bacterium]